MNNKTILNICENCIHAEYMPIAVDGQDSRNSQYPPLLFCGKFDKVLDKQVFECDEFEEEHGQ